MNRFIVLRTIIIGDIHGCDDQLKSILGKLQPDPETDMLILLGDLFDRGPESWEVFQTVKGLREDFGDRFILLRGNHEDYLLRENISFMDNLVWVRVGKKDTIRSFRSHGQKMESAIPWLKDNIINYYKGGNFQCVHAGIKIDPLEANDTYTLIHDHDVKYFKYGGDHQKCVVHEQRYVKGSEDNEPDLEWNTQMAEHLRWIIHNFKEGNLQTEDSIRQSKQRYYEILDLAM
jgi:serine/threonine protein phosphatase 1